jgi:hypothetical protein
MADIPKAIERLAEKDTIYLYGLLILLDGEGYWECTAATAKGLETTMRAWRVHTLPSLKRSQVRYFVKSPGTIKEITINFTEK